LPHPNASTTLHSGEKKGDEMTESDSENEAEVSSPWDQEDIAFALRFPCPPVAGSDETLAESSRRVAEMMHPDNRPQKDDLLFYLVTIDGTSLLTMPDPDGGYILLAFTSEGRAEHYRGTLDDLQGEVKFVGFSLEMIQSRAQPLAEVGISKFIIDRCPYCDEAVAIPVQTLGDEDTALVYWATNLAIKEAQYDRYLAEARRSLQSGEVDRAKILACHMVTHIDAERPEAHLLLGECGIRKTDHSLYERKIAILGLFGGDWAGRLKEMEEKQRLQQDENSPSMPDSGR
jgi:hypothetical protein